MIPSVDKVMILNLLLKNIMQTFYEAFGVTIIFIILM